MKKKFFLISILVSLLLLTILSIKAVAMKESEIVDFNEGIVIASKLHVRAGPGLSYEIIDVISNGEKVKIFGKIDDWYIVQNNDDFVGCVKTDYLVNAEKREDEIETYLDEEMTSSLTEDEKEMLSLINEARVQNGLNPLQIDDELQNVVRIKAQDMVDNNYFSHESVNYGTPFEMMKANGITYRTAGENIAGNSENKKAFDAWMNSESHKSNILNNSYNYTGIAVVKSDKYGKIFVQMFIGK